jgi:DNA-nicking Smr family endonuclease
MIRRNKKPGDFSFRPFRKLKASLSERSRQEEKFTAQAPAEPTDQEIFMRAMKDVREIKEFRDLPVGAKPVKPLRQAKDPDKEALRALEGITRGRVPIHLSHTQEYIEWTNPDAGPGSILAKELHEGKFAVQDMLDLHGYTVEEADVLVYEFLRCAFMRSFRCVRIIHGRGLKSRNGPALKTSLAGWLSGKYRKYVIAYVSARQCDGGLGATYILLKAPKVAKKKAAERSRTSID